MKSGFSTFLILILTVLVLGQATATNYVSVKEICGAESPLEESADEDADNEEELDKFFQPITIENPDLSYSVTHHSFFEANLSELIREIVPPPPKA